MGGLDLCKGNKSTIQPEIFKKTKQTKPTLLYIYLQDLIIMLSTKSLNSECVIQFYVFQIHVIFGKPTTNLPRSDMTSINEVFKHLAFKGLNIAPSKFAERLCFVRRGGARKHAFQSTKKTKTLFRCLNLVEHFFNIPAFNYMPVSCFSQTQSLGMRDSYVKNKNKYINTPYT